MSNASLIASALLREAPTSFLGRISCASFRLGLKKNLPFKLSLESFLMRIHDACKDTEARTARTPQKESLILGPERANREAGKLVSAFRQAKNQSPSTPAVGSSKEIIASPKRLAA